HRAVGDHSGRREPVCPDRTLLRSGPASHLQPGCERPGPGHWGDPFTASPRGAPAPADARPLLTPTAALSATEQRGGQHARPGPVCQPAAPGCFHAARRRAGGPPRTHHCGQWPHGGAPAASTAASPARGQESASWLPCSPAVSHWFHAGYSGAPCQRQPGLRPRRQRGRWRAGQGRRG
ncbi:hypothetical protein E2I00_014254, partial [Balaenoptera physalus]